MIIAARRPRWHAEAALPSWDSPARVGWVPIDVGGAHMSIRWMNVGDASFAEPFFEESITKLRNGMPAALELESELSELRRTVDARPLVRPSAVIVHMTRCGSTLLMNAFKAADGVVGLSEASSFDRILQLTTSPSAYWRSQATSCLADIVTLFGNYAGPPTRQVVIKCGVGGGALLTVLRTIWPDVPCIALIRNPLEIIVSNCKTPARWLHRWKENIETC